MNIALYEDSRMLSNMIKQALEHQGHNVAVFTQKEIDDGEVLFSEYKAHIVTGRSRSIKTTELIQTIRNRDQENFIIVISSKNDWKKRVEQLRSGADEVIEHPFPMEELIARIERSDQRSVTQKRTSYEVGDALLDPDNRCMLLGEESIDLRRKEYGIIEYLAKNKDRTVSRSELMDHVWDYRRMTSSNTVDVHISNIRKKLGNKDIIRTVHGFGYRLESNKNRSTNRKEDEDQLGDIPTIS